jgi:hypothetical protein
MSLEEWAVPHLAELLPLERDNLITIIQQANTLPNSEATRYLGELLSESPEAMQFIFDFMERRAKASHEAKPGGKTDANGQQVQPPLSSSKPTVANDGNTQVGDVKARDHVQQNGDSGSAQSPPAYAPPPGLPPSMSRPHTSRPHKHTNQVIKAGEERARDEVSTLRTDPVLAPTDTGVARDAADASESAVSISDLQFRHRARA